MDKGELGEVQSQRERGIRILTSLGLTQYQARVFLSLEQKGILTANSVAAASSVPREKVYGVLNALMEMGLVGKVISSPTTYKSLKLEEAVILLLDDRQKNHDKLREAIGLGIEEYKTNRDMTVNSTEMPVFEFIQGRQTVVHQVAASIEKAGISMNLVLDWKTLVSTHAFLDLISKANKRGVLVRAVFQSPKDLSRLKEMYQANDFLLRQGRIVPDVPQVTVLVFDDKWALVCTEPGCGLSESPAIFTDNHCFLELANTYFWKLWQAGQPYDITDDSGLP